MNSNTKKFVDDMITKNYEKFLNIARTLSPNEYEDIVNECIIYLYDIEEQKLQKIKDYIEYYMIQMIKYSATSKTSKYQQKYHKIKLDENIESKNITDDEYLKIENFDEPEPMEFKIGEISKNIDDRIRRNFQKFVDKKITFKTFINLTLENECSWYEREVFVRYHQKNITYREFSKETKIPLTSLFNAYSKTKRELEKKLYKKKPEKMKRSKKEIAKDIYSFLKTLRGRSKTTKDKVIKMFNLYNEYYKTNENNYSCDLCVIRVYSKLKKISENYEQGKRFK